MGGRRLGALAAVLLLVAGAGCRRDRVDAEPRVQPPLPASMAALGDSITRAFAACEDGSDCPQASWSTGTVHDLHSHHQRIAEAGGPAPRVHNIAVSGATVLGLDAQARQAVAAKVEYVTLLTGANDACTVTEEAMTPVDQFEAVFVRAMDSIVQGLPHARILVVSIPDLARLWELGKDHADVRARWEGLGICQSMLADPTSTAVEAHARRWRVRDRVIGYNRVMAAACERHPTCRWDGNALFDYDFSLEMVSAHDYWHPSMLGQRTIAEISWNAGYWGGS